LTVQTDLVRRAQRGDEEAFAALVPAAVDRLIAVAYRILRDPQLAEDATQQALLIAWRKLPTLRDPDHFDAWTYRLLVNACYAEAGRRRGNVTPFRLLADDAVILDSAAQAHDRDQLERGFTRLSIAHRTVVVLRLHVGLPFEEIATMLDIPVGTARSRLHYALRALRAAIEADDAAAATRGTA
jgi:RNA polymerase sigma-70 factor (ECF subfamily)